MLRTKLLASVFLSFLPVVAATMTFRFNGGVDATAFGLGADTPLVMRWTYDTSQAPQAGSNASYVMPFTVDVGGYTIRAQGVLAVVIQPAYHQFWLGAAIWVPEPPNELNGLLNGRYVTNAGLNIVDGVAPRDMLGSTSLPASAAFIGSASLIQFALGGAGGPQIYKEFTPGSFEFGAVEVPEPATVGLVLMGLLVLMRGVVGRVSRKNASAQPD